MDAASLRRAGNYVSWKTNIHTQTPRITYSNVAAPGQTNCRDKKILIRLRAEKVKQSVANHVLPSESRFELNFNVRSLR